MATVAIIKCRGCVLAGLLEVSAHKQDGFNYFSVELEDTALKPDSLWQTPKILQTPRRKRLPLTSKLAQRR